MGAFLIMQRELCELWSWSSKIASRPNMASVANYSQLLESGWINYIGDQYPGWQEGHQQVSRWKKLIAKCRLGRAGAKWRNARNVLNCFVLISSPIPGVIHKQKLLEQCGFFWEIQCDMTSPACDGMCWQGFSDWQPGIPSLHPTNVIHSDSTNRHFLWASMT